MGVQIPHGKGEFWGKEKPTVSIGTSCRELYKNGWTDRFAVWIVDSSWPKEAQVQSYSPGGTNMPSIPLNRPCAEAMWPVVKLLWPLVSVNWQRLCVQLPLQTDFVFYDSSCGSSVLAIWMPFSVFVLFRVILCAQKTKFRVVLCPALAPDDGNTTATKTFMSQLTGPFSQYVLTGSPILR